MNKNVVYINGNKKYDLLSVNKIILFYISISFIGIFLIFELIINY